MALLVPKETLGDLCHLSLHLLLATFFSGQIFSAQNGTGQNRLSKTTYLIHLINIIIIL